jgi:hypothetical protein
MDGLPPIQETRSGVVKNKAGTRSGIVHKEKLKSHTCQPLLDPDFNLSERSFPQCLSSGFTIRSQIIDYRLSAEVVIEKIYKHLRQYNA